LTRRRLLAAGLAALGRGAPAAGAPAETLRLRLESDGIRVSAPQLRFLTGRPLERLHNGSVVDFDFHLAALAERPIAGAPLPRALERALERFAVSYDLWEEKYSASRLSRPSRSASHLAAAAVPGWCLDHLPLPIAGLAPDRPFWIRLEVRAEDSRDRPPLLAEPGISLARLIELFSRPSRGGQPPWLVEDGPFRLADLRTQGRGG